MKENVIVKVEKGSIADELNIQKGDILLTINEKQVKDVFDYRYAINEEYVEAAIKKTDGRQFIFEIEKESYEDLGIVFENGLMDNATSCKNKCIFCFIDQMPKGMRKSLYFKDDDTRLSFLQGNYVTLTNISEKDFERILYYKLSPIQVSVHATDDNVRQFMLKNPKSKKLLHRLNRIYKAGIEMNFQVVLCKGINDKDVLIKTIEDLAAFYPIGKSLSIVPVGITKYRDNLYPLERFSRVDKLDIIQQVTGIQKKLYKKLGVNFVYLADEFYLDEYDTEIKQLPKIKEYDGFPQIENGVGMMSLFIHEINSSLKKAKKHVDTQFTAFTGILASNHFYNIGLSNLIKNKIGANVNFIGVENEYFGENITVSGLVTAGDIIKAAEGIQLGKVVIIPKNMLKRDEDIFLDDISVADLSKKLGRKIYVCENDGHKFIELLQMKI